MDGCIERLTELQGRLDRFDTPQATDEVRWFERRGRGFALHITPLEVSEVFNQFRETVDAAWVFTSATLAVRGDFSHFTDQMGLADAHDPAIGFAIRLCQQCGDVVTGEVPRAA